MNININTDRNYQIVLQEGILHQIGFEMLKNHDGGKICIISDKNSDRYWGSTLRSSLEGMGFELHSLVFPPGERTKSFKNLEEIINYLANQRFSKSDFLIGLGGGVIGDLTGFAASIYMRGIEFYNIPTTLLSAVDSSVGGKTAINLVVGKNMAGTFWQPSGVFFDINTLQTLPNDQIKNGLGEIIKAGVIMDESIISILENHGPNTVPEIIEELIYKSINVKKEIVQQDEREKGPRQTLNLGHTVGHAVENLSRYKIPHGQAVSIGLLIMAKTAERMGWAKGNMSYRLEHLYQRYNIDVSCPFHTKSIVNEIMADKKRRGNTITLAVPLKIGQCTLRNVEISQLEDLLKKGMEY